MRDNNFRNDDEITLKELVLKIKEFANTVLRSWWLIAIFCAIAVSVFLYQHSRFEPTYNTELKFVVEGQSGGGGGLSSLLGSFGIKKGGKVNPYKILEVGKSTDILLEILAEKTESKKNIANILLEEYELIEKWSESNDKFVGFEFGETISRSGSEEERIAIKKLRTKIWGKKNVEPLTDFSLDDETGIYSIKTEAISEELSLALTQSLYDKIKLFFEEEVFQNQKQLADILTMKADSIKLLSEQKIRQIARFDDSNRGIVSNQTMATKNIMSQESFALNSAYAEILKNREMTDVNLKDMQPLFIAIDNPFSPINPSKSSLLLALIKGILLGGFLGVGFVIMRKVYRDIMASEG